ncbi:MAG: hypothetical protein ACR2PX_00210 [Endozoicomonas sp.]|uniref:hypothetical protein n=1 Tax=Endozoicomonas sp. TaxID=1892382 RepID=UPI003D9B0A18
MIFRIEYNSDLYMAAYISSLQLVKILRGSTGKDFNGSLAANWNSVNGTLEQKKPGAEAHTPDITFWQHHLALSPAAYEALNSFLSGYGELLPMTIDDDTWYIWNATTLADDCIDHVASEQTLRNGKVTGIKQLSFSELPTPPIFKLTYDKRVRIFCTSEFKSLVESLELSGLTFSTNLAEYD